MSAALKPFVILNKQGEVVMVYQTNEKGYKKSLEHNQVWAVNPGTGRLLPEHRPGKLTGFSERKGWYQAFSEEESNKKEADTPKSQASDSDEDTNARKADSSIIPRLYRLIEQRKKDLPEGSYTTHLFNSGLSKIRKKTGEEAVELILAESREETVYEAADLIYHMLVLLAAEGINPEEIFKELESRE